MFKILLNFMLFMQVSFVTLTSLNLVLLLKLNLVWIVSERDRSLGPDVNFIAITTGVPGLEPGFSHARAVAVL